MINKRGAKNRLTSSWCTLGNVHFEWQSSLSNKTAMKNATKKNCPSQDIILKLLHWNVGGLTQEKRVELLKILHHYNVDVFTIVEANKSKVDIDKFKFPGFTVHILEKQRKVAGGILVGIKSSLTGQFSIIKEMGNTVDKSEVTKTNVWKNGNSFKIFSVYNPPNNTPDTNFIPLIASKTILVGDFNAHSKQWGYKNQNPAGTAIQYVLNTTNLELKYKSSDTNPDLLMVSSDINSNTKRKILDDPGSGHRIMIAKILIQNRKTKIIKRFVKSSWNFKKS